MKRSAIAVLLFALVALPGIAQQEPDISVTLTLDHPNGVTGERASGTLTVRNDSNVPAGGITAEVQLQPSQQALTITGPAGWECAPVDEQNLVQCRPGVLPAGAQAAFRFTFLARNDLPSPPTVQVHGSAFMSDQDATPANNDATATLTLSPHGATTALSVQLAAQQNPVTPGTNAVVTVNVRNDGPAVANDLLLRLQSLGANISSINAPGWTCVDFLRTCRRPFLAAGESSPLTLTIPTFNDIVFTVSASVGAEHSFDPSGADNQAQVVIAVGDATDWKRILLPVVMSRLPGLNGSLWETEITAFLQNGAGIFPRNCSRNSCLIPIPRDRPFRPSLYGIAEPDSRPAQFIYAAAADIDRVSFNLRVRDLNRTAETWGTEVPAVREEEFRTAPILLMPLPVDPLFRTNVRIYDLDARANASVAIHVYADDEVSPRATFLRTFTTWPETVTTVSLPRYPGYVQFDLGEAGAQLAGAETAWIRIEPRTQGLRFWAFASVTNNPTGHVTTVTPQ